MADFLENIQDWLNFVFVYRPRIGHYKIISKMKSSKLFALFAALLFATASFSQGLITVRPAVGDTLSVRINDIEMAFVKGSKTNLLLTGRKNTIVVIDSLGYIVANSCDAFLDVTEDGIRLLLSKNHLKSVTKSGTKARVVFLGGSTVVTDDLWPDVLAQAETPVGCGGGGGATDLSYTAAATNGTVNSSTGNDATVPARTGTNAGLALPIPGLTALTSGSVDAAADYFEIWDNSASAYKKILATFTTGGISDYAATCTGCNAGSALRVRATGSGVTVTYSSNNFTVNIPAGVLLLDAHFIVTTSDIQASADGGGFTDWVTFTFNTTGGDGNTGVTTLRTPQVQKVSIPSSSALAANNGASIDQDNNPACMVIGAASNDLTIRLSGMSVGAQGYGVDFSGF